MSNFKNTIKKITDVYETSMFLKSTSKCVFTSQEFKLIYLFVGILISIKLNIVSFDLLSENQQNALSVFGFLGVISFSLAILCLLIHFIAFLDGKSCITIFKKTYNKINYIYHFLRKKRMIKNSKSLQDSLIKDYDEIKVWFEKEEGLESLSILIKELKFPKKIISTLDIDIKSIRLRLKNEAYKKENFEHFDCDFLNEYEIKNQSERAKKMKM